MSDAPTPRPFVIPIFIPHAGCPHRCVFCDQTRTTNQPEALPTIPQMDETITRFLSYRKDARRHTEISFYGGNFLGLPSDSIAFYLQHAARYVSEHQIQGIRFSTRPETVTPPRMELLAPYPVTTVELGVQSMNNEVLKASCRGHSVRDSQNAAALLKMHAYRLGLQMMVGLPRDTPESAMDTGRRIADLEPDFVRIYPTLVLKGSLLADWYQQGLFHPMALDEAVALTKRLYALFVNQGIKVIRMGLQAEDGLDTGADLLAGPYHPAFGELVHAALWLDAMRKSIKSMAITRRAVTIETHPRMLSRVKGNKNINMEHLTRQFDLTRINTATDNHLPLDRIRINGRICPLY